MSLLTWLQFLADLRRDRSRIGSAQQAEPEPRPHARMATVQMPPVESGKLRLGMVFSYG